MSTYASLVRHPLRSVVANHLDRYPTPANLSYLWGFGSLAGRALVIQIVTGVCLARHYAPEVHLAFASVEHIRRDVRGGAGLRYVHANGASRFFIIVYTLGPSLRRIAKNCRTTASKFKIVPTSIAIAGECGSFSRCHIRLHSFCVA